jgi:hypothetical protein
MEKIDVVKMESMLRAGHTNAEVARHFGVTDSAVCQRAAKIKNLIVRQMSMEKAHEMTSAHIDVVGQLNKINESINYELEKAQQNADKVDGKERIAFQRVIIELSAEVRRQLDSQLRILELWHDAQIQHEFQTEVLNVLDEVQPGLRDEIISRLKKRRILRKTVSFD